MNEIRENLRINLMRLLEEKKISQKQLATELNVTQSAVSNWIKANNSPNIEIVAEISKLLSVPIAELLDKPDKAPNAHLSLSELSHIKKYRTLNEYGKKMVDTVLDLECEQYAQYQKELSRQKVQRAQIRSKRYPIPAYYVPMSAGTGAVAIEEKPETIYLVKQPPYGTDFIAPVRGDSMEPDFRDGDMVFVQSTPTIEVGQVGVFLLNGEQYIKELGDGVLISHNPDYEDIPFTEDIRCWGLVLSVCDDSYFE